MASTQQKKGYEWLLSQSAVSNNAISHTSWSWIWKLHLPEKYKFLAWLACHDAVPTLSLLNHRNIAQSALCTLCGQQDESFLHCICDCLHSSKVWRHIGFGSDAFFAQNNTYALSRHFSEIKAI